MRDHIISHKNGHGAAYLQPWRSWLKINFCEIFGVVRLLPHYLPKAEIGNLERIECLACEDYSKRK